MRKESLDITIPLTNGKSVSLKIKSKSPNSLFLMEGVELEESEAPYQIVEGNYYDYKIDAGYFLKDTFGIALANEFDTSIGSITPSVYVGTLTFDVCHCQSSEILGRFRLEVQSAKTDYRSDYRKMLSDITDECVELVFQHSSPVTQTVEVDYENDNRTWHQRFAFIKSVIDAEDFIEAVNKITSAPVTRWKESEFFKDIRRIKRFTNKSLSQISRATNRLNLPKEHPLRSETIKSLPATITIIDRIESVDTSENRFVKHVLKSFLSFATDFKSKLKSESKLKLEVEKIENMLEQILSHSIFKGISIPSSIVLNSPILQRKEGYREILRVWLMFNLAAQLTWKGGDDVYDIEKRNVATLYEYWLYFQLLKIVENVFGIKPNRNLIVDSKDKLGLQLKQGEHFPIHGVCEKYSRKLHIQFSYNRTFPGSSEEYSYPESGSWTRRMRPDYTLSIWPAIISEKEAEKQELITHLHFDAKYRIENILESLGDELDIDKEKEEQNKGTYKRADLLKMHSYKDAIRRTGGAYILYPGKTQTKYYRMGFRELIPGLGAFQIRPSETNNSGSKELKDFFNDVVLHFVNRTSQREKTAFRIFDIHKSPPNRENEVKEDLPEPYGSNRDFFPDETFVLIGFYEQEVLPWIEKERLYNFRTGTDAGSLPLGFRETTAKYLLLHSHGEAKKATKFYKLKNKGPKLFSKEDLVKKGYPSPPKGELYLVYELELDIEDQFKGFKWDITKLKQFKPFYGSGIPFSTTLAEVMSAVIKK